MKDVHPVSLIDHQRVTRLMGKFVIFRWGDLFLRGAVWRFHFFCCVLNPSLLSVPKEAGAVRSNATDRHHTSGIHGVAAGSMSQWVG